MKEAITSRFRELAEQGEALVRQIPRNDGGVPQYWVRSGLVTEMHGWLMSVAHLLASVAPSKSPYVAESRRLLDNDDMSKGIPAHVATKMMGLLVSAMTEWDRGLLRDFEYIVLGVAFDDFLDQAALYHRGGKVTEAAVLASAVFEDGIKRLGRKHDVEVNGKTVEPIIDDLVATAAVSSVVAKRLKSYAGVRNHALHAEWDQLDLRDVGAMIQGLRELLVEHF